MLASPASASHRPLRLEWLDAIRGISCLAVVIYHYTTRFHELYGHDFYVPQFLHAGAVGVLVFFIVSGFVISLTLERGGSVFSFIYNRFSRLYPAYWVAIVLTYTVVSIAGLPGREVGFGEFVVNFTMLQEFFRVPHVDGAYWTLTVELIFYFWIVLLWRCRLILHAPYILVIISLATIACSHLDRTPTITAIARLLLLDYGIYFFSGVVFYQLWSSRYRRPGFAIASIAVAIAAITGQGRDATQYAVILAAYASFFAISLNAPSINPPRALTWLGGLTYSLYLVHQNIGYVLIRALNSHIGGFAAVAAALGVCVCLAVLLQKLVENPALHWLRMRRSHLRKRAQLD